MPMRPMLSTLLVLLSGMLAAEDRLRLTLHTVEGTGDAAMIVAWAETGEGKFVRTLMMYSHDRKYFKDMTAWQKARANQEPADPPDALLSPTLKWNAERTAEVPCVVGGVDLRSGNYVVRVEQRKDKGGHYKKIRIPLTKEFRDKTVKDEGYLAEFTVRLVTEPAAGTPAGSP